MIMRKSNSVKIRFMRLILFFDLPQQTDNDRRRYRSFVKNLKELGFIRVQYSVYSRLCIDSSVAKSISREIKLVAPKKGDIRYLIVSESNYNSMIDINDRKTFQEKIINMDRLLVFGDYDENC